MVCMQFIQNDEFKILILGINISSPLIKYADLSKDTIVIGVGDRLEIWSENRWNKFIEENEDNFSEMADNLFSQNLN